MDLGKILAEGTPLELVRAYAGEQVVQVQLPSWQRAHLEEELETQELDFEGAGESLLVFCDLDRLSRAESAWAGHPAVRRPANLEDVFLRLTGRGLRDQ